MAIAIVLLYLNIHLLRARDHAFAERLDSCLYGIILWNFFGFISTQILSVFHVISLVPLWITWGGFDFVLLLILWRQYASYSLTPKLLWEKCIRPSGKIISKSVLFFGVICIFVIAMALCTVPYNWDSMTYHLPRIAHWAQNQSVAHYASHIVRQLTSPVLAEFLNLQVYVLTGNKDSFLNMLQCVSFLMNAAIIYGIARRIKCNSTFCRLAALLFLTTPIAFSEALTTQVDNYAALWLLIFVYLLLDFTRYDHKIAFCGETVIKVCAMGLCVSLGYLAKPTVCISMCIFVLWLLFICIRRKDKIKPILLLICCALPAIILPLIPEMARNITTFHAISDPSTGKLQLIGTFHPSYIFINLLKNVAFNLPNIYLYDRSSLLMRLVVKVSQLLNVDLNHPSIVAFGRPFVLHGARDYGHDTAVNPIIVILLVICVFWFLLRWHKKDTGREGMGYCIIGILSFVIFCCMVRWSPFVSRYMIGNLALVCPVVTLLLQKLTDGSSRLGTRNGVLGIIWFVCIVEFMGLAGYHYNIYSNSNSFGRTYGYFVNRTTEYEPSVAVCDAIIGGGYKNIGIYIREDDYEYPFWAMLQNEMIQIQHVNVQNQSAIYEDVDFQPDCVIWIGSLPEEVFVCNGITFGNILPISENYYLLLNTY